MSQDYNPSLDRGAFQERRGEVRVPQERTPEKIRNKAEDEIRKIIFRFLDPKKHQVFIFGSRATEKAKKFSDYDIGIWGKRSVSWQKLFLINEALEETDLPVKVDIVDFSLVSSGFRKVALSKIKKL